MFRYKSEASYTSVTSLLSASRPSVPMSMSGRNIGTEAIVTLPVSFAQVMVTVASALGSGSALIDVNSMANCASPRKSILRLSGSSEPSSDTISALHPSALSVSRLTSARAYSESMLPELARVTMVRTVSPDTSPPDSVETNSESYTAETSMIRLTVALAADEDSDLIWTGTEELPAGASSRTVIVATNVAVFPFVPKSMNCDSGVKVTSKPVPTYEHE